jgi:NAD(P)-dependent dehydrogenase (short-subunit alcohol dehydrogenase family)
VEKDQVMLLKGKNAIVTGAAAGIGQSIAERMAEEGANVILADIDETRGRALEQKLRAQGSKAWFVPLDVADVGSIRQMLKSAIEAAGPIDILVNNAAVTKRIGILDMTEAEWDWIQSINTRGLFFCLQIVAAHMCERRSGKIVNMSSIGGKGVRGTSNAGYAASKAAAIAIARVAAAELGSFNININSVCPGPTRTNMLGDLENVSADIMTAVKESAALKRINQPEDIANAVIFLCSSLADNITGQSINVDNGTMWD